MVQNPVSESNTEQDLPEGNLTDQPRAAHQAEGTPTLSVDQPGVEPPMVETTITTDEPQGQQPDVVQNLPELAAQPDVEPQQDPADIILLDEEEEPAADDIGLPDPTVSTPLFTSSYAFLI